MSKTQKNLFVSAKELVRLIELASYRTPMQITEIIFYYDAFLGYEGYYVCPRCKIPLDRDFMSFCNSCGQKLDWKDHKKAKHIFPKGK